MSKKRKAGRKRGRREFLKALPSAGAAFKWTADKLGGYGISGLAGALLARFSARPGGQEAVRNIAVDPRRRAQVSWVELEVPDPPASGTPRIV